MDHSVEQVTIVKEISPKSGKIAWVLCLFMGMLGVHRFYVGKVGTGLLMLLTAGGLGVWTVMDLVAIANSRFEDKHQKLLMLGSSLDKSQRIKYTAVSLILWLMLFIGSIISVVMYLTSGLVQTVSLQLEAIQQGNPEKAYSYTSKDFQNSTSLDEFKIIIDKHPSLKNNASSSFYERSINNNIGSLRGTLTSVDGGQTPVEYILIYENDRWKIYKFNINPKSGMDTKD